MNTEKIESLLDQIRSTAEGLSGVAWLAQLRPSDAGYQEDTAEGMQVQIDNLQAALNQLKIEVAA